MRFLLRTVEPFKIFDAPALRRAAQPAGSLCVEIEPGLGTETPLSRGADSSSEATVVTAPWRKRPQR